MLEPSRYERIDNTISILSILERGEYVIQSKRNGFTLIEVMISLVLLSIVTIFILPVLIKVYQERVVITQQEEAIYLLEELALAFTHGDSPASFSHSLYHLEQNVVVDGSTQFCLKWEGANSRYYESCLYTKK
ncbi:prepilin-type N-terminal cleavage/methylation domain-containing protein [Alkalihalobacillus sp. NPDC078783]